MDEKEIMYGAETPATTQTGTQVQFAITKSAGNAGTKGTAGAGWVEFNESTHKIYVNGIAYGGDAADIESHIDSSYEAIMTHMDASYKAINDHIDSSVKAINDHIDASYTSLTSNISNLRMFKTIGGVSATTNSDTLTFSTDDATATTIVVSGKDIKFGVGVATDASRGTVLSGGDITVGETGTVTVNHATAADKVDVATATATDTALNVVLVSGASTTGADLKESDILKYVVSDGKAHLEYSGDVSVASAITTKKYVDDAVNKIEGEIADGMHYCGGTAAIPTKGSGASDALAKGDFFIATGEFTIGDEKVESGDYIVYNGTGWDIVNRNLTQTSTIDATGTTTDAMIATVAAIKSYVTAQNTAQTYVKALSGDNGSETTASHDAVLTVAGGDVLTTSVSGTTLTVNHDKLTAGTAPTATTGSEITLQKSATAVEDFTVVTGVTVDAYGHTSAYTTQKVNLATLVSEIGTDISNAEAAAKQVVDQNAISATSTDKYNLLAGTGAANGETYYATVDADNHKGATLTKDGDLEVHGLTVNGKELDMSNTVQDAEFVESATGEASITDGKLTVKGVQAIGADGTAKVSNTYNAQVLAQSIFWTVVE